MFVSLFVWKGVPLLVVRATHEGKDRVPFMESQFPTPRARQASVPLCTETEGHTCIDLGVRVQSGWQWSTNHPRSAPGPSAVTGYSKVSAASMAGLCEKVIMSDESHLVVFMIGWLCSMSNRACWKHGHSLKIRRALLLQPTVSESGWIWK